MPWSLEIHHIDLTTRGDATLIIARETPPFAGAVGLVRSLLIDGGLPSAAARVDAYLAVHLGPAPLDAMVSTHYEIDHVGGLINLLRIPARPRYANTRIYDQGWEDGGLSNLYLNYLYAINGRNGAGGAIAGMAPGARRRLTRDVNCTTAPTIVALFTVLNLGPPATPIVGTSAALQAAINQPPNSLLGVEILWDGRPVAGPAGMAPPVGAPTVTCIAANQYVQGHGGFIGGIGVDVANDRSLAFIVEFNGFRYYIGGDITNPIEAVIAGQLNVANDGAGRVTAIKSSHHGSDTATSRAFVSRLRPEAAFISCGTANQYLHPAQQTVNVLDGYPDTLVGAHPASPPAPPVLVAPIPGAEPPNRPVDYFLTGYQVVIPPPPALLPQTLGGDTSFTAGDPRAASYQPGHILVTVSQAQSLQDRRGAAYRDVSMAVRAAALAAGVPLANANAAATVAAEAVLTHYGPGEAARQVALQLIAPAAVGRAAVAAAVYDAALQQYYADAAPAAAAAGTVAAALGAALAAAVAAAAPAPPVAAVVAAAIVAVSAGAAAAGAAVGAYQGRGAPLSLSAAVNSALAGAVFPVLAAGPVALLDAVVAAPGPGLFDVIYWDLNAGPAAMVAANFS